MSVHPREGEVDPSGEEGGAKCEAADLDEEGIITERVIMCHYSAHVSQDLG